MQKESIVICGGGLRYLPSTCITLSMLRTLGWSGETQVVGLQSEEDSRIRRILRQAGAHFVVIDAAQLALLKRPWEFANMRCEWLVKPIAVLNAPTSNVLFMDADNLPIRNPKGLFENEQFRALVPFFGPI